MLTCKMYMCVVYELGLTKVLHEIMAPRLTRTVC